jgi:hypothetical protein
MKTIQEIAPLQQAVGKELEGQGEPKFLENYQRTIENLTMLIKKALDDGSIRWDEAVSIVEAQGRACDLVMPMLDHDRKL